jgi:hypothetical protein
VLWLVQSDLAAAGELESAPDAPLLLLNLRALDLLGFQEFDLGTEVVTHEIERGRQQAMSVDLERPVAFVSGMNRGLGGRQFEDQPWPASTEGKSKTSRKKTRSASGFSL